jgi:hypothetical protein
MLDVPAVLPGPDEGRAPVEEICVHVIEESKHETALIRMEFGARWHEIVLEGKKAVVERKISDDEWGGTARGGTPFLELGRGNAMVVSASGSNGLSRSASSAEDAREGPRASAGICVVSKDQKWRGGNMLVNHTRGTCCRGNRKNGPEASDARLETGEWVSIMRA